MGAALVDDALEMAVTRRKPGKGVIHHSDHGSQYKSLLLGRTMRRYGIVPSMGAIASPWDNAVTESLMSTIKVECDPYRFFGQKITRFLFENPVVFPISSEGAIP